MIFLPRTARIRKIYLTGMKGMKGLQIEMILCIPFIHFKNLRQPANGGCDWNAGVPACNAVASAASNFADSTSRDPFRA